MQTNGSMSARITLDGKVRYIGNFKTAEEAHEAFMLELRKAHGPFVPTSLAEEVTSGS
jgi:hypothetical protein